ncbi:unnamed protein product [Closterium sp. Naga37s-1]|nr:unnamed protein product [Closterium sp. Naga37s-1]
MGAGRIAAGTAWLSLREVSGLGAFGWSVRRIKIRIAAFRNMGAGRIAAGTLWLSLREWVGTLAGVSSPPLPSSPSFPSSSSLPHQMAVISIAFENSQKSHQIAVISIAVISMPVISVRMALEHSTLMAVMSVRRALEHFYLARSVSARWLWKLTKDPTQSAIRKVGRGLTGLGLITSVTITNVRAHFLSPLSSVAVQLITDTLTAFHRLLFPPPPPQAGQGLAISPVRATGVQIVWLVKRTLSYSLKLVFSTASGALLSAVCVRYVGPWTTSYAYILGDMFVYQTASTLIDPLLFSATT